MKRTISLNESDLHRIIKETVNKVLTESNTNGNVQARRELLDALYDLRGIMHSYNDDEYGLSREQYEKLFDVVSETCDILSNSFDYGPYEDEPYYFGY